MNTKNNIEMLQTIFYDVIMTDFSAPTTVTGITASY